MPSIQRYLQIDEEGYWISDGLRITDEEYGRSLLEDLRVNANGSFSTTVDGIEVLVEAFDEPLVARTLEQSEPGLTIWFPYRWPQSLIIESLTVDEWDRFHGRTDKGVPYVLSRAAQAQLFDLVDSFDDESITINGFRHVLGSWLVPRGEVDGHEFWTKIYQTEEPGWDLGKESPVLPAILPQLRQPRSRVLVLGCGNGHDAAYFARSGHIVTAVDFSPSAIENSLRNYGEIKDLKFAQADAFRLPENWRGQFDIVFEHTCYCAIDPERRTELAQVWKKMLAPGGHLLGIFFTRDKVLGPPWGGSEWEVRERLKKNFEFQYWTRWRASEPRRQGCELVIWAEKRSN